jgi:hypothetical protein
VKETLKLRDKKKKAPITTTKNELELHAYYTLQNTSAVVRSCFCPLLTTRREGCVVTGSEDGSIYLLTYPAFCSISSHRTFSQSQHSSHLESDYNNVSKKNDSNDRNDNNNEDKNRDNNVNKTTRMMRVVNKLQGHNNVVLDIDWSYDESFLVSGDGVGM